MARHKQIHREPKLNFGSKLWPYLRELVSPAAFMQQLTEKDLQTLGTAFTGAPMVQKGKILLNILTGRVAGLHLFKDEYAPPQTMNPAGMINKWTTTGVVAMIYSKIPLPLPLKGKIGAVGRRAVAGGMVGGFFDAPNGQSSTASSGTANIRPPEVSIQNNYGSTPMMVRYSGSTKGAFD